MRSIARRMAQRFGQRGCSRSNIGRARVQVQMLRRYPWLEWNGWGVEPTLQLRALLAELPDEEEREAVARVLSDETVPSEGIAWLRAFALRPPEARRKFLGLRPARASSRRRRARRRA